MKFIIKQEKTKGAATSQLAGLSHALIMNTPSTTSINDSTTLYDLNALGLGGFKGRIWNAETLRPTAIEGVFYYEEFLKELNRDPGSSARTYRIKLRRGLMSGTQIPPDISMLAQIRLYVDEWLNTGRKKDGSEDPSNRDLTKAPNANNAVARFNHTGTMILKPVSKGLILELPGERRSFIASPNWDPLEAADRRFVMLMLSNRKWKLAKCLDCGLYYDLKRSNSVYKKGTRCPGCDHMHANKNSYLMTAAGRQSAQSKMFLLVGEKFSNRITRNPNWNKEPKLKEAIVKYLNAQLEKDAKSKNPRLQAIFGANGRDRITVRWLGWQKNRDGIEMAAREKEA